MVSFLSLSACSLLPARNEEPNTALPQNPVAAAAALSDGNYVVNAQASSLAWTGSMLAGKSHTGLVPLISGNLSVQAGSPFTGDFVVAVNELSSDEKLDGLEKHLKGPDFFDVENFPSASLKIDSVTKVSDDNTFQINGTLTIKGISAPLSFPAKFSQSANNLTITADFSIDRTVWGLKYGSGKFFPDLGDKVMNDDIKFKLKLEAQRS